MLRRFIEEVETNALFTTDDTILLAVSGGMDSVTMCELFYRAGYKFAIAHCNFRLRGGDSNGDECFVHQLAKHYNVPIHSVAFDTKDYAAANKLSIEEAARNLRYDFFDKVLMKHNYTYVATAHHHDDAIETFFLNLIRGTGIVGLHGILQKNEKIIRPLLCFTRNEIEDFIHTNNLSYRTDVTNATLDYKRNKVRHMLVPIFRELASSFDKTMHNNMQHIADVELIYKQEVERMRKKLVQPYKDGYKILIEQLLSLTPLRTYLYEFLSPMGFTESVVINIIKSLNASSGKMFFGKGYYLIKDREYLLICPSMENNNLDMVYINETDSLIDSPITLHIDSVVNTSLFKPAYGSYCAYFDKDKLIYPLHLRRWKDGDKFHPFGMKGKRKLSDFFTDKKLSLQDKKNVWLLCNGDDEIMWILGLRTDDRFKLTIQTQNILKITWKVE